MKPISGYILALAEVVPLKLIANAYRLARETEKPKTLAEGDDLETEWASNLGLSLLEFNACNKLVAEIEALE